MLTTIFTLLLLYQLKHFLADYPLQRPWMLGKFLPGWQFVVPLAAHCAVHGLMTFGIAVVFSGNPWLALLLALLDFKVHFLMDRIKASPKLMGRWKPLTAETYAEAQRIIQFGDENDAMSIYRPSAGRAKLRGNRLFWDCLGIDQMVHHLTHYLIIFLLIRYS